MHKSLFQDKHYVCAKAYANLFEDAIRILWGRMGALFLSKPANVPWGLRGGNTGGQGGKRGTAVEPDLPAGPGPT